MDSFIEKARAYASYHQNSMTRYTHFVGVPLIIFSLMILLGFLHFVIPGVMDITFATIATIVVLIYYFLINWRLALAVTVFFLILLWIAHFISRYGPTASALSTFAIVFIIGVGLQFLGHFLEGNRPAFLSNLRHLFIAPLYLTAELFFLAGFMPELKEQIGRSSGDNDLDNIDSSEIEK